MERIYTQILMGPIDLIRHPILLCGITVPEFIKWYFLDEPKKIICAYLAYFRAFNEIFSFVFLLRTLIAPWKQITDSYPKSLLYISQWSQTIVLNILSRIVGAIFRLSALVVGIAMQCALLIVFSAYLALWITFPVVFWLAISFLIAALK